MRLTKARVQNYRSVRDTGWFDVEHTKTIMVGPNEAGKTAFLRRYSRSTPDGVRRFNPLRITPAGCTTPTSNPNVAIPRRFQ